jgi:hypothetical protein
MSSVREAMPEVIGLSGVFITLLLMRDELRTEPGRPQFREEFRAP